MDYFLEAVFQRGVIIVQDILTIIPTRIITMDITLIIILPPTLDITKDIMGILDIGRDIIGIGNDTWNL